MSGIIPNHEWLENVYFTHARRHLSIHSVLWIISRVFLIINADLSFLKKSYRESLNRTLTLHVGMCFSAANHHHPPPPLYQSERVVNAGVPSPTLGPPKYPPHIPASLTRNALLPDLLPHSSDSNLLKKSQKLNARYQRLLPPDAGRNTWYYWYLRDWSLTWDTSCSYWDLAVLRQIFSNTLSIFSWIIFMTLTMGGVKDEQGRIGFREWVMRSKYNIRF